MNEINKVNMPHWSWIKDKKPDWKPLHERIIEETYFGTNNR